MIQHKLYLIGNAHIDPVWLWRWQEGFAEIKATFQSALDRMEEFPGYIFTSACTAYYEWIEHNEPAMFEQIRQRIAQGRWVIAGGWYVQPDCNIPCGESFARHSLYSQRYFREKFGRIAKVGYNVDSFGHNAGLPQILRQSGMQHYVFMRPMKHEKQLPANLFIWRGADGSEVTAFRIPICYATIPWEEMEGERDRLYQVAAAADAEGADYMAFFGVGNHGGGATIELLHLIEDIMAREPGRWIFSSPDAYFTAQKGRDLPVQEGDLQHHAPGCYSAHSKIKADNRRAEHTLLTAEQLCTTASLLFPLEYPHAEIAQAWKDVLFNQFHDILGGCCIKEAYDDAAMLHGEALAIGERNINSALQKISWNIDTTNGLDIARDRVKDIRLWENASLGTPVVVYNPLSWEVTVPVTCSSDVKYVTDAGGNVLPFQRTRASRTNGDWDKYETIFLATIPAFGYTVCRIFKHAACPQPPHSTSFPASDTHMENEFLLVDIDPETGCITRLYRKDLHLELLRCSCSAEVMDETDSDTWAHNISSFHNYVGQFGAAQVKLVEAGPVRTVIRAVSTFGSSELCQHFTLVRGSRQVDVRVRLTWLEQHKMLKLAFPVNVTQPTVTADAAYAHIEREADGMEDSCQQWVDLHGWAGETEAGLALLNDSKYGYDTKDNVVRMTAVRSPIFADHYGERDAWCEFMDQGVHEFRYVICPHSGNFAREALVRRAYELNVPPRVVVETFHKGELPCTMTGICIPAVNVMATAFKPAEDGKGYILRCFETDGTAVQTTVTLPLLQRTWPTAFRAGEIKTFYIPKDADSAVYETNLLEWQEDSK